MVSAARQKDGTGFSFMDDMYTFKRYDPVPVLFLMLALLFVSCEISTAKQERVVKDSVPVFATSQTDSVPPVSDHMNVEQINIEHIDTSIRTGKTTPAELLRFAETLSGIPYVWASSDPSVGFDCSGFITYVFNHFHIAVPRSSIDFTSVGKTVDIMQAKTGDLILFTGTNPMEKNIGHMGIVVSNTVADGLHFIHSTSGKAMSVTTSPFNDQYKKRFVRISRIFPQNG